MRHYLCYLRNIIRNQTNDKIRFRVYREFAKQLYVKGVYLEEAKFINYMNCMASYLGLDRDYLHNIPRDTRAGLAHSLAGHLQTNEPLNFYLFASHAIDSNSTSKVSQSLLSKRNQYHYFSTLQKRVDDIASTYGVQANLKIVVPNFDYRYPWPRYKDAWNDNKRVISEISGIEPIFLSEIFPTIREDFIELSNKHSHELQCRLQNLKNGTLAAFRSTEERAFFEMKLYTCVGYILRKKVANPVVVDMQRRKYPYQQPFYNKLFWTSLGILTLSHWVNKNPIKQNPGSS